MRARPVLASHADIVNSSIGIKKWCPVFIWVVQVVTAINIINIIPSKQRRADKKCVRWSINPIVLSVNADMAVNKVDNIKYFWGKPKSTESKSVLLFRLNTYSAHSRPPCAHSYTRPIVRIRRIIVDQNSVFIGCICDAQGVGNNRAISRSNSRNRMAIKKKRIEKGRRADPTGSKPHS